DFGSQYTQLIARRVREQHVYCCIQPCTLAFEALLELRPCALILSGGPASVFAPGAPQIDSRIFEMNIPILGICYGMQLMAQILGGDVEAAGEREYGPSTLRITQSKGMFRGFASGETTEVWMSHGDRVKSLPSGFEVLGVSSNSPFAAVGNAKNGFYALQFHPEVVHTSRGTEMLRSFLFEVVGCPADWTPGSFVAESVEHIRAQVGSAGAVCGLSGGVDSAVAAMLVSRAIGERLTCVFVDNGLLRQDEANQVVRTFRDQLGLNLVHVDAADEFLCALDGVSDPEQKRKVIGRVFVDVFEREAKKLSNVDYLVQGTLYPDVIESVSFKGPSAVIKSHHNVGGLPDRMALALVEPLRELFKDEVRAIGKELGMASEVLSRQPFPGPGLAVRCLGTLSDERLRILRESDSIFEQEIRRAGLYDCVWQAFCVLVPVKTVGVMGDNRTYEYVIALRAVDSKDGMTADWSRLPFDLLAKVSSRIINEVRGCNRVVYDISSKPPATIEWE
ncbi:MAG: glutamine-hydrolyzing GMP synthase, partial [Myxococcota bacterium]